VSTSFEFPEVDFFTAGTEGDPGQRTFFLQAGTESQIMTLKVEKQQVEALGEYLAGILADLPDPDPAAVPEHLELRTPIVPEWTVGSLGLAYDDDADRVVLVAEELVDEESGEEGASARLRLTREQVGAFVPHAAALVGAGRPPCPICGRPMNPDGHVCPRSNGHVRPS
jgi:uncharacterized repeat protein (TIGR03847 family)